MSGHARLLMGRTGQLHQQRPTVNLTVAIIR
jgi:hypothetical protein